MKYSVVVLDLDGTFLNSSKQVSERNLAAVLSCYSKGMKIIIATARPPRAVRWFLPGELMEIGSFVYYNGAQVVCEKSNVEFYESISFSITSEILEYCLHQNPEIELTMEFRDEWFSLRELDYSNMMNVKANPIVKSLEELKQYEATKILISGFDQVQDLYIKFDQQVNILVTDNNQLIQIMPLNASKERAVTRLCNIYNISMDSVIIFGDDHNDLGLFKTTGYSIAMGNAINELKEIANEVTEGNDQDGVAIILERLCG